jgi:hypothetical protein
MSSVAASLVIIQQNAIRYGFPILLALGNIGNFLFIITFSRKQHRHNPCSLYLLTSAVIGLIGINWGLGTNLNAIYQSPDPFTVSLALCRTRGYILQVTTAIHRTMIALACMDRFALSSSRVNIRAYSKPKVALKMIVGSILFWMIGTIDLPIFLSIQNNLCMSFGTYALFHSIYQICVYVIIFPALMIVFGILLWKNLKHLRVRVQPLETANNPRQQGLQKRDIDLMKFVLAEVVVGIILTYPQPTNLLYTVLASNVPDKSQKRMQIEAFISFIALLILYYLNFCVSFYLYVIMSKPFRQEIKRTIFKCLRIPVVEETTAVRGTIEMRNMQTVSNRGLGILIQFRRKITLNDIIL